MAIDTWRTGNYGEGYYDDYYNDFEDNLPESCPVCGSDSYDYLYKDYYGDIVGCDECITRINNF